MRKLKAPFLAVIVVLFNVSLAFATPNPPAPMAKSASTASTLDDPEDPDCVPPICDPGTKVPIDDHIILLAISGLLLGATVIYKNKIKKASV